MTEAQFLAWLADDKAERVVLVQFARIIEEEGGDPMSVVDYFSTLPYVDRVNGIAYNDCIIGLPEFNRELTGDLFANYQSSHGNLELDNTDGDLDYLLDAHCDGSQQQYFVGDASWPLADFRDLFTAITVNVEAPSISRLVVSLKDSSALLEQNIGGVDKVGGTGPYADRWRPLVFGYLRQYEYLVQDEVELRYVYADNADGHFIGEQEQIVYDRGVPVDFINNGDGTVTLLASPDGAISGNVHAIPQGDDTQWLMSDALLELVGERAGFIANSLWAGPHATYIDDGDEDWPVGILISDKRSLLEILEELADSGLLFWAINRSGLFTYGRIRPSYIEGLNVASSATITLDEIDDIDIERLEPRYHRLQALMARNWFTSDDLAASLTAEERAALSRPGLYGIQGNSVGSTYEEAPERYNLTLTESPVIETLLSGWNDEDDALVLDAWMEVRRAMFLPWLDLVTVTVDLTYYTLELGDVVTVQIPRFGWDAGVTFQVIGISMRPVEGKIRLRLIRRHIQGPYEGRVTNAQEEPESADLEVGFGEVAQPPIGIPPLPGDDDPMFPQPPEPPPIFDSPGYDSPGYDSPGFYDSPADGVPFEPGQVVRTFTTQGRENTFTGDDITVTLGITQPVPGNLLVLVVIGANHWSWSDTTAITALGWTPWYSRTYDGDTDFYPTIAFGVDVKVFYRYASTAEPTTISLTGDYWPSNTPAGNAYFLVHHEEWNADFADTPYQGEFHTNSGPFTNAQFEDGSISGVVGLKQVPMTINFAAYYCNFPFAFEDGGSSAQDLLIHPDYVGDGLTVGDYEQNAEGGVDVSFKMYVSVVSGNPSPYGTGGVFQAPVLVHPDTTDPFLYINGDVFAHVVYKS
jgi:hypothetical protein